MIVKELNTNGFSSVPGVYDAAQLETIEKVMNESGVITESSHGARQLFQEVPELREKVLTKGLLKELQEVNPSYKCVKSVYFNKPEFSNWVVPWHQDLFINVKDSLEVAGFRQWQKRGDYFSVQPPISMLENIIAVRIHLDVSDESNGTLKVVAGSHLQGVQDLTQEFEASHTLTYAAGDVMFMKPLLLHASGKSKSAANRRVIHLEFCSLPLPNQLEWKELTII